MVLGHGFSFVDFSSNNGHGTSGIGDSVAIATEPANRQRGHVQQDTSPRSSHLDPHGGPILIEARQVGLFRSAINSSLTQQQVEVN